jgi:hypothetical protein
MHGFEEAKLARARGEAGRTYRDGAEPTEHHPDVHRSLGLTESSLLRLHT